MGLGYEAHLERTPGVARSYWAALTFLDGKLVGLLVVESKESVNKGWREEAPRTR